MIATMKRPPTPPAALAELLGSAQADAERFHGRGPARAWRPAFAWKTWAAAAGGLAATATAGALFWQWGSAPVAPAAPATRADGVEVRSAAAPTPAPAAFPTDAATVPIVGAAAVATDPAACAGTDCTAPAESPRIAAPAPGEPVDMDTWALDPQGQVVGQPWLPPVAGNLPVIPDEHDPTPAEEPGPEATHVDSPDE